MVRKKPGRASGSREGRREGVFWCRESGRRVRRTAPKAVQAYGSGSRRSGRRGRAEGRGLMRQRPERAARESTAPRR